jgi:glycosyltransferase involved in cell wall biosynthesis
VVSIIIPAFRASAYIAQAVRSVFNQSYRDFEVIVVNDGSPDTAQLIEVLAPWRDRLIYIEQENGGAGAARNMGLSRARGDLVAFLDADDRWLPGFLESQVRFLETHRDCDMVYADARLSGDTPLAGSTYMATTPSEGVVSVQSLLAQRCTVITSAVVARRAAIEATGGFDASLRRGQDFDLWVRMAHLGARIDYRREVLVNRTVMADGLSADPITELERALRVLNCLGDKLPLAPADREMLRRRITVVGAALELERGKRCLRRGHFTEARRYLHRSMTLAPRWKLRVILALLGIAPRICQRAFSRLRPPTAAEAGARIPSP